MARIEKMVHIGTAKIRQLIEDTMLTKGAIGDRIGLTKGGFWHVTHVSGKMNIATWKKFQEVYYETVGKYPNLSEELDYDILQKFTDDDLLQELKRRMEQNPTDKDSSKKNIKI